MSRRPKKGGAVLSKLWKEQKKICAICGELMSRSSATLDHIIPRSKGGANSIDNLQATHLPCNQEKADTHIRVSMFFPKIGRYKDSYARKNNGERAKKSMKTRMKGRGKEGEP